MSDTQNLIPAFPPHVNDLELVSGTTACLLDYEKLPEEYRRQRAKGCEIASTIFYEGWEKAAEKAQKLYGDAEDFEVMGPPEDYEFQEDEPTDVIDRFQRCVTAHLKSWEPKHEHKIAGVGYMIDHWCRPIEG